MPARLFKTEGLTEIEVGKLDRQTLTVQAMELAELSLRLSALCNLIKLGQKMGQTTSPFLCAQQQIMNAIRCVKMDAYRLEHGISKPEPIMVKLDAVKLDSRVPGLRRSQ